MYDKESFVTKFPVGQFPVQLAIAKNNRNEFVAFSRIFFSDKPVDHWEFALQNGQTQTSIFGDSIYYYSVDSGIGGFVDDSSYHNFTKLDKASQSQVMDELTKELDKKQNASWQSADINDFCSGKYSTQNWQLLKWQII